MKQRSPALNQAITNVGGVEKLAQLLGLRRQSLWAWKGVPRKYVIPISEASGVPPEALRPDLYPAGLEQ